HADALSVHRYASSRIYGQDTVSCSTYAKTKVVCNRPGAQICRSPELQARFVRDRLDNDY
ncbi:hypothetical protein P692DRAFT_20835306, partial [Suillus brevipes Sb2]